MTREETAKIIAAIAAAHPSRIQGAQVGPMVAIWHELLMDLEYPECNLALRALLQTSSWPPTPADVRRSVIEIRQGPPRSGAEAWGSVLSAIRAEGAYRTPGVDFVFYDPLTARVVDLFGWQELCLSENAVADRARFIEAYEAVSTQARKEVQSPVLAAARERREGRALPVGGAVANALRGLAAGDSE